MSSEDGTYIVHHDEWIPFSFMAPAEDTYVDLIRLSELRSATVYAVRWPYPGTWDYWRQR